jgi:hypothetical protein
MADLDEEQAHALRDEIEQFDDSSIVEMPFELLEKPGNKTTQLAAPQDVALPVEGRNRRYNFRFKDLFFVTRVSIFTDGYANYHSFKFAWSDESGKKHELEGNPAGDVFSFEISSMCGSVSFQPPPAFFSSPSINKVRIEGIPRNELANALNHLSELESYRTEILTIVDKAMDKARFRLDETAKTIAERASAQREITQHKAHISRLKKSVEDVSLQRSELIAQNAAADARLLDVRSRLSTAENESLILSKQNDALTLAISDSNAKLKDLKSNINLFPTEIVAFVNQGSRNLRQYFWLAAAPIAIIVLMFVLLVRGAADLTTVISNNANVNIEALMLSRAPYVTISLAIITACYKISRAFIMEMIKINNQRLGLTKISIIAKDVSSAAEQGLNLTDEDAYRLRTELKMNLLKDHLKDYISKDFKVELPRQIIGINFRKENTPPAAVESESTQPS